MPYDLQHLQCLDGLLNLLNKLLLLQQYELYSCLPRRHIRVQ